MAFRVRARVVLGIVAAATGFCGSMAAVEAADDFSNVKIEFDAVSLVRAHDDNATPAAKWIDLETASAKFQSSQSTGMIGFDKPILNMPDGSTATLNLGAHGGAIRAGITWNLD
jgi:glutaredoxin-related protein